MAAKKPTPYQVRWEMNYMSFAELERATGLSGSTLRRLEDPWHEYNIHVEAAELFAKAFNMHVDDIAWPRKLVFKGRRPLSTSTNRRFARKIITTTITTIEEYESELVLCEHCVTYQVPFEDQCSCCGN